MPLKKPRTQERKTHPPSIINQGYASLPKNAHIQKWAQWLHDSLNAKDEQSNKEAALRHAWAVSYAMTGKSGAELFWRDINNLFSENPGDKETQRVQSILGGAFLRMYLDHELDSDIIAQAGEEIRVSREFKTLQAELQGWLMVQRSRFTKLSGAVEKIEAEVGKVALNHFSSKMKSTGIAFRHELNPVIGGVSKIDIGKLTIVPTPTDKGLKIEYVVDVIFFDTYDFDNKRVGEYDTYRKTLAQLLKRGNYEEFRRTYHREMEGAMGINASERTTRLDHAAVFASYMYALEQNRWTPGPLAWNVTVPMAGSFLTSPATRGRH